MCVFVQSAIHLRRGRKYHHGGMPYVIPSPGLAPRYDMSHKSVVLSLATHSTVDVVPIPHITGLRTPETYPTVGVARFGSNMSDRLRPSNEKLPVI